VQAAVAGASILICMRAIHATGGRRAGPQGLSRVPTDDQDANQRSHQHHNGGGHGMSLDERIPASMATSPEWCSLNMGSMNFGLFPAAERFSDWRHEWGPAYLEMTRDFIFRNTFADIERILKTLGEENGTRFEFECYDVGHLYNLAHFLDRGLVKPPLFILMIFGILGGIGAEADNLLTCASSPRGRSGTSRSGPCWRLVATRWDS
jgi:uncharacterized protein (DUF849 family)